jgi:uncharacterized protein (TIGR03437 family)
LKKLLLFVVLAWQVPGQISDLATNHDGSAVLFAAPLRLRGAGHPPLSNIYRADSGGFHLEAGSAPDRIATFSSISADGRVQVDNFTKPCTGIGASAPTCNMADLHSSVLRIDGVIARRFANHVRVSRSGRYALLGKLPLGLIPGNWPAFELERLDLQTGEVTKLGGIAPDRGQVTGAWVASNGTCLVAVPGGTGFSGDLRLVLVTSSNERRELGGPVAQPALTDDASYVIYTRTGLNNRGSQLWIRTAAGEDTLFMDNADSASVAGDSRRILFLRHVGELPQVFIAQRDNPNAQQVTSEPEGIIRAVISGDGNWAYATTSSGRLIKANTQTGTVTELIGRTLAPRLSTPPKLYTDFSLARFAAGSVQQVLKGTSASGLIRVSAGDMEAPVVAETPTTIIFQIPWEAKTNEATEVIARWDNPQWEAAYPIRTCETCPAFLTGAIHEDWRGFVSETDPARAGEIVYFYANGLGPVEPRVATGQVTPLAPLSRVADGCRAVADPDKPLELLFAGLAPGTVGHHVVIVRMPQEFPLPITPFDRRMGVFLFCGAGEEPAASYVTIR